MEKYNFIKTSDKDSYEQLVSLGFKLVSKDDSVYTFVNDGKMSFDDKKIKVKYSNLLTL